MALNNFEEESFDEENIGGETYSPEPRKPKGNRTFLIAIGIIGILFVVALILLLLVAPRLLAQQRATQLEQAAIINANNTATALAATVNAQQQQTAQAAIKTQQAAQAADAQPTKTPVVVIERSTSTPEGIGGGGLTAAELATVAALQTQMAAGTPGATATSTALPTTGFAEDFGLPMMAGLAIVLVAVIILSRRLRLNAR